MIRNLKTLLLAAMAVTVMGAIWGASAVQAHTPAEFHCDVEPCTITSTKAGTAKEAHHVIDVPGNGSVTCNEMTFDATVAEKTTTTITITDITYHGCTYLGQAATVNMNGCHYLIHANGDVSIQCPDVKEITFGIPEICQVHIPPQGPLGKVSYTNYKPGAVNEITVHPLLTGIKETVTGPFCPIPGPVTTGEYTTGTMIATGEEDKASGAMVNISWTSTVA